MSQPLIPAFTAHCFFGWCRHAETALDPRAAHDAMEAHYRARHQAGTDAITGRPR